ncbi:MAG: ABC transporter permease [Coriobacteriia bacterium]|nr:ABC transporter permease [Coriobacteriia bacterium]
MNIKESFKIALKALNANKVRAMLTMLGIIIGVSSVILLVSIGTGVKESVLGQFGDLGSNLIYVLPGDYSAMTGGGGQMTAASSPLGVGRTTFTDADVELINSKLSRAIAIPFVEGGVRISNGSIEQAASFMAADGNINSIMKADMASGRMYNQAEVTGSTRVVVLGSAVAAKLFPTGNEVSRSVRINGQNFRVIGVKRPQGGGASSSQDSAIDIPYTTAQRLLNSRDVSMIAVSARTAEDIALTKTQIKVAMRPKYGSEFSVMTQDQMLGMITLLVSTMTYMLAGIASISLLVGGIGIMNIMLVSVSERTREIGIRKAVGARTYDILAQFVIEAVMLSVLGGIIGITIGALGAWGIHFVLATKITGWSIAVAFFFSAGVGVFFGVYPAYKASKLDPIEALRYE